MELSRTGSGVTRPCRTRPERAGNFDRLTDAGVEGEVILTRYDRGLALTARTDSDGNYTLHGVEQAIEFELDEGEVRFVKLQG